MPIDIDKIRSDFPFFEHNPNIVYFDNAATTQKPKSVINSLIEYCSYYNANVHRGVYSIAEKATYEYELTRDCITDYIGATNRESIIFTSGATESINLVAKSWAKFNLKKGDHILISQMEHHSNIVPWQMLKKEKGIEIDFIPVIDTNQLDINSIDKLVSEKTKLISIVHQSNVLGTINDIEKIIKIAKHNGAKVLIDASQSIVHQSIDVNKLDCDFFVFSGHKIYAPTGVGVLYGKMALLEQMIPLMGGGEMIDQVSEEDYSLNRLPLRLEAGTPPIMEVIALRSSINYIKNIGIDKLSEYEEKLVKYAEEKLNDLDGIELYSPKTQKGPILTFNISNIHSYDLTKVLDEMGIAIRSGHHCAQPLMNKMGITSSSRASFSFYNTISEVDYFIESINKSIKIL